MIGSYLIAHKVRGEPAFDVALRMECPLCHGTGDLETREGADCCIECDNLGYWWIVPTSGHRAYPWWNALLIDIDDTFELAFDTNSILESPGPMPPGLPDHYTTRATPTIALAEALGLTTRRAPAQPIKRRF